MIRVMVAFRESTGYREIEATELRWLSALRGLCLREKQIQCTCVPDFKDWQFTVTCALRHDYATVE